MKQSVSQLCVSAWWIFVWTASAAAQFQFDITQQELAIGVDANVVVDEKPAQVNNGMIDVRANVDSWLFSSHGNEANARRFLDNQLDARIAMFDGMFELSDSQTTKLQMAGSFDIVRYFAEADRIRSQFGAQVNQNDFNKVWQEVQPLRQKFQRGLLSTGSMFAKVSKNSLDEKQYREFAGLEAEKLKFAYRSTIKLVLTELEKLAPLRDEQRRQILEVLSTTDPPNFLGEYTNYVVLYRLSQNKDQLNKLLTPGQTKAWAPALQQGQGLGQFLRSNGILGSKE